MFACTSLSNEDASILEVYFLACFLFCVFHLTLQHLDSFHSWIEWFTCHTIFRYPIRHQVITLYDMRLIFVRFFTGFMLHRKPLYVAIAQRKEERQAQLQLQHAQRLAGLTGASAMYPGAYPPLYYPGHGVVPQVPARPGLMYQSLAMRPGWGTNGFTNTPRPSYQPASVPMVSPCKESYHLAIFTFSTYCSFCMVNWVHNWTQNFFMLLEAIPDMLDWIDMLLFKFMVKEVTACIFFFRFLMLIDHTGRTGEGWMDICQLQMWPMCSHQVSQLCHRKILR